ncbi:MAG: hypothetical protein R3D32_09635 [Nitratireductor sp.]
MGSDYLPKPCDECGRLVIPDDVVMLTAREYRELIERANAGSIQFEAINSLRRKSRSPIVRNTDMAKFILEARGHKTLAQIARDCQRKWGKYSPSKSSIDRFLKAAKREFEAL